MVSYNPNLVDPWAIGFGAGSIVQMNEEVFFNPELISQTVVSGDVLLFGKRMNDYSPKKLQSIRARRMGFIFRASECHAGQAVCRSHKGGSTDFSPRLSETFWNCFFGGFSTWSDQSRGKATGGGGLRPGKRCRFDFRRRTNRQSCLSTRNGNH